MATKAKYEITDFQSETDTSIVELKFNSKDEKDTFYNITKEHFPPTGKVFLGNGPFLSKDEHVVSIGYKPEDKERVMEFVNQHSL